MRPASTTAVTVALLAAILTGCTGVDRAPTTPGQSSATTATGPAAPTNDPAQPTAAPTTSAKADGVAPRVTLRITGGFAARGESIVVEPDGRWTVTDRAGGRRIGRLTATDQGTLAGLATDPRLATEARQPTTATKCSDAMHYRLTVASNDTVYTTCPEDGTPPPATQAVVKLLLRTTKTYVR